MTTKLVFLKLGGSLITVKEQPHTPRLDVLDRLSQEIAQARSQNPDLRILLGHGSGSFGHAAASELLASRGNKPPDLGEGYLDVWRQASDLDQLVLTALENADLPAIAYPPSASVTTRDGRIIEWNLDPLKNALEKNLLPVIYGDVILDVTQGRIILSTEELFVYLARHMHPTRLLFAGKEPGVWRDFPANTKLLTEITPQSFPQIEHGLKGSAAVDVTGGMHAKVRQIMSLFTELPRLRALIFSGEVPGNVHRALLGEELGTLVYSW